MERDLVPGLQVLGRDGRREPLDQLAIGVVVIGRGDRGDRDPLQQARQFGEGALERRIGKVHVVGQRHQRRPVAGHECIEQAREVAAVDHPEHLAHGVLVDLPAPEGDRLVEQRQGIAHAARGGPAEQAERRCLDGDALGLEYPREMAGDRRRRHVAQVQLHAARQDRDWHALRIGGRQHEQHMPGRLLERLEHRVEGVVRQHVDFVDHVHLEAARARRIDRVLEQLGHLVDAPVRGRVELHVVDEATFVDLGAGPAGAAGRGADAGLAVHGLGDDARQRRLADAAGTGEQVCVVQAIVVERMRQCAYDVVLPDQRREVTRAPFPSQYLMCHAMKRGEVIGEAAAACLPGRPGGVGGRAGTPAPAVDDYGCFLPDLTRFATPRCGEARPPTF